MAEIDDADLPLENQPLEEQKKDKPKKANGHDLQIVDPLGNTICLPMATWTGHITLGHPELKDKLEFVDAAIVAPQVIIREDRIDGGCTCFYYRLTGRTFYRHNDIYVVVVVEMDERSKTGTVKTAYLVKEIKKGGKGKVIWMNRN